MWVLVEVGQLYYMLSKVIATAVVMIYNFITRKLFIERKKGDNQMSNKINALQKKWIQFKRSRTACYFYISVLLLQALLLHQNMC